MSRYITVDKYAQIVGRNRCTVFRMLAKGRIQGARKVMVKNVMTWAIPEDAPWPESLRWANREPVDINDYVKGELQ